MMSKFIIPKLRPCMVIDNDIGKERKAFFHCWGYSATVIGPSALRGGHPGGQVFETYGIVEMEDGEVKQLSPYKIKFLDHYFNDYDFGGEE